MTVDPAAARGGSYEYKGVEYFFCNPKCNERFRSEPDKYLSPTYKPGGMTAAHAPVIQLAGIRPAVPVATAQPTATSATADAPDENSSRLAPAYICPMCPEVRSAKPGACPSCGMALEPETLQLASRTEYVCPMHPEISQDHPGTLPKVRHGS